MGVGIYKINFNHLYYFLTIAEEGTIVAASKKLHMTQPALSQQLKSLELDLGKDLFERKGRKLVLNDFGFLVKDYATKIFRQSDEMLQALSSDQLHFSKTIRVGVLPWVPQSFIYDVIKPLLINPYLKINTQQGSIEDLTSELLSGNIDLAVTDAPYSGKGSKKLTNFRLKSEDIYCVGSKNLKLKGRFPEILRGKRLVNFPSQCLSSDKVNQFLDRKKIDFDLAGEFHNLSLSLELVQRGAALGFFPHSTIKDALKNKTLKSLGKLENGKFSYWILVSKKTGGESVVSQLIKELRLS